MSNSQPTWRSFLKLACSLLLRVPVMPWQHTSWRAHQEVVQVSFNASSQVMQSLTGNEWPTTFSSVGAQFIPSDQQQGTCFVCCSQRSDVVVRMLRVLWQIGFSQQSNKVSPSKLPFTLEINAWETKERTLFEVARDLVDSLLDLKLALVLL